MTQLPKWANKAVPVQPGPRCLQVNPPSALGQSKHLACLYLCPGSPHSKAFCSQGDGWQLNPTIPRIVFEANFALRKFCVPRFMENGVSCWRGQLELAPCFPSPGSCSLCWSVGRSHRICLVVANSSRFTGPGFAFLLLCYPTLPAATPPALPIPKMCLTGVTQLPFFNFIYKPYPRNQPPRGNSGNIRFVSVLSGAVWGSAVRVTRPASWEGISV